MASSRSSALNGLPQNRNTTLCECCLSQFLGVCCHQNDWNRDIHPGQHALQFQATQSTHAHIEDQTRHPVVVRKASADSNITGLNPPF